MNQELALDLRGITKRFGSVVAVDNLDLVVPRGQTLALLGPNGAGKSTTISILLGLTAQDTGDVAVLGGSPRAAITSGGVGAMLQSTGILPDVRVREIVQLVRALYPRALDFDRLVADADLAEILDQEVGQLSGGQQQRVRLALALAGDPDLLVLDEPTVAMDVETRRTFWARIGRAAQSGRTVLFATHYLAEAEEYSDRVVVVNRGRVVADGSPASLTASVAGRTVRFTLAEPSDQRRLDGVPGVSTVELRGNSAVLATDAVEETLRALLSRFDRLPDLTVSGASLEDAFVALTQEPAAHV